jgi:hypothetical protein
MQGVISHAAYEWIKGPCLAKEACRTHSPVHLADPRALLARKACAAQ